MNGQQIEDVLKLIDGNIALTRGEVAKYIRENQQAIAQSLLETGTAVIKTSAGSFPLRLEDLQAVPA